MTAQVRAAALLAGVDAHYAREQKREDQLESARRWAVALEQRIEEIRDHARENLSLRQYATICFLIDAELVAE